MTSARFYAGLFLITAATLMLQLIQTRILSVVAWYHLAFFAISMAMFGLTAGAVWVYLRRERFTEKSLFDDLTYFSTAFAVTTAVCFAVQMTLVPIVVRSATWALVWAELAVCMAIPFFFSGVVVSLALTRSPFPIGRVYAADLIGAAVGCLGVLALLNRTDAPSAVLWVGVCAAAGALCFAGSRTGATTPPLHWLMRRRTTIFLVLVACAIANGNTEYGLQPLAVKGKFQGGNTYLLREWNSFSRIAVYAESRRQPAMWGPSPTLPPSITIDQRGMAIDGDAGTTAFAFDGDLERVQFLKYDLTNLAYFLPDRPRAAIIGVGGGRDLLSAAVFGRKDITGVEINPIFVRLLTEAKGFADFTNLDEVEGIEFVVDDARSWFARTDRTFDVVQMSLIDTWAATGAGAFTLSENGLYTIEAWRTFMERLSDHGVFTVSRWYSPATVNETGRTLSLAVATLMAMGVEDPSDHLFLAAQKSISTLVLSRAPFSAADLDALHGAAGDFRHRVLASPRTEPQSEILRNIVAATDRDALDRYTSGLLFDLTPPTDDRPFFFNQLPLNKPLQAVEIARSMVGLDAVTGGVRAGNLVATATLVILFLVALVLVLATIVIPLRPAIKDVGSRLAFGGTLYFLLIGAGFMMIEISLLQRMSVFLGHPIYSLSVLLFTLILTTGIGSLLSDRFELRTKARFAAWAGLTGAYVLALPLWLPGVFASADGASLLVRASVCVATISPAGLLMGFGFPTGMRLIAAIDQKPTPWFWGINGAAGVLASIFAVACSIALGIGATTAIGAICYPLLIPVGLLLLWPAQRKPVDAPAE